jgi:hypothetical protein
MKTLHISDIIENFGNSDSVEILNKHNDKLDIYIDLFCDEIGKSDVRFTFDGCNNGKNDLVYYMDIDRVSTNYDTLIKEGWFDAWSPLLGLHESGMTLEQYALTEIAYFVIGQLTGEPDFDQDCFYWWLGTPTKI